MTRRLTATLAMLTISACLMGCVSSAKYPAYYTLHVPAAIDAPIAGGPRSSLAVREFRSPTYLRQAPLFTEPRRNRSASINITAGQLTRANF